MRNTSHHPFLMASKLSRNAYRYWKNVSKQPLVRRVQSTLLWLPTLAVFTQVGYTLRAVTGNSMQVRTTHPFTKLRHHDNHAFRPLRTLLLLPPSFATLCFPSVFFFFCFFAFLLRSICQLSQR
jgi:hypothetical protein